MKRSNPPSHHRYAAYVEQEKPVRIKITSLGSAAAGKSCLIKRFCEGRFVQKYIATIGVDYGVKPHKVNGQDTRVNFWDLSGQPDFFEVRNEFYKDTQGLLLVYDVSDAHSFDELDTWMAEARKHGLKKCPGALCANKVDMRREVSEDEGREWAKANGMRYFETSAATGASVAEMFEYLFEEVVPKRGSL